MQNPYNKKKPLSEKRTLDARRSSFSIKSFPPLRFYIDGKQSFGGKYSSGQLVNFILYIKSARALSSNRAVYTYKCA